MFKVNDNDTRTTPNVALLLLLNLNRCFSHEGELSNSRLYPFSQKLFILILYPLKTPENQSFLVISGGINLENWPEIC